MMVPVAVGLSLRPRKSSSLNTSTVLKLYWKANWREALVVGMYIFDEGGVFLGQYDKGLRAGLGIHVTPAGSVYSGDHVADRACGVGRMRQVAGRGGAAAGAGVGGEWVGVFKGGVRHGPGRQEDPDGAVTVGTWALGVPSGACVATGPDGVTTVGAYQGAVPVGKHVAFNPTKGITAEGVHSGGVADAAGEVPPRKWEAADPRAYDAAEVGGWLRTSA
jgi:hypothetical protein